MESLSVVSASSNAASHNASADNPHAREPWDTFGCNPTQNLAFSKGKLIIHKLFEGPGDNPAVCLMRIEVPYKVAKKLSRAKEDNDVEAIKNLVFFNRKNS